MQNKTFIMIGWVYDGSNDHWINKKINWRNSEWDVKASMKIEKNKKETDTLCGNNYIVPARTLYVNVRIEEYGDALRELRISTLEHIYLYTYHYQYRYEESIYYIVFWAGVPTNSWKGISPCQPPTYTKRILPAWSRHLDGYAAISSWPSFSLQLKLLWARCNYPSIIMRVLHARISFSTAQWNSYR